MAPRHVDRQWSVRGNRRLYVKELTDAQLRQARLTTTDPTQEPNLSTSPPAADAILTFEMTYESAKEVKCVFHSHRHKKGLILRDESGRGYLIGNCCGLKEYGLDWRLMAPEGESLKDSQRNLLRCDLISQTIASEMDWLAQLPEHPAVKAFDKTRSELRGFAHIFGKLEFAVRKREGRLYAEVPERDFDAEQHARAKRQKELREYSEMSPGAQKRYAELYQFGPEEPIYKYVNRLVGTVRGSSLVQQTQPMTLELRGACDQLIRLPKVIAESERTQHAAISLQTAHLLRAVRLYLSRVADACQFFDFEHLEQIAKWATADPNLPNVFKVTAHFDELVIERDNEVLQHLKRPTNLKPIPAVAFDRITSALGV